MKFFIDTANLDEIRRTVAVNLCQGVTTNPSLIKKAVLELKKKGRKIDIREYIKEILRVSKGPVSLEVTATEEEGIFRQALLLYEEFNPVANNVVIKVPINPSLDEESASNNYDGLRAIKRLAKIGIPVNCTLIFTPFQAYLAKEYGARYISPFAGRLDDYLREKFLGQKKGIDFKKESYWPAQGLGGISDNGIVSGVHLVKIIAQIVKANKTEVIAASIRNQKQISEVEQAGADIATVPYSVLVAKEKKTVLGPLPKIDLKALKSKKLTLLHPKTVEGMISFKKDAESVPEYANLFT